MTTEDDGFWAVAMGNNCEMAWDESDDENEEFDEASTKAVSYRIPSVGIDDSPTILRMRPLPPSDGIWSPVGADAWYASALLASILLLKPTEESGGDIQHPFARMFASGSSNLSEGSSYIILELGSGAVGLPGFVCAVALERQLKLQQLTTLESNWRVLLTDNDSRVLQQLQRNLDENKSTLLSSTATVDVQVATWDWKENHPASGLMSTDEVVLVIGSELVYTQETANACIQLLLRLLEQYPNVEIWISQVSDRFGWWETVVPTLVKNQICVDSVPIPMESHNLAATMIPMGGTLDRHAYGIFCIHRKKNIL